MFEKSKYNIRPTKTGGKAIIELKNIIKVRFPKKLVEDNIPEIGKPIIQDINNAAKDTLRDNQMIS